MTRRAVGGRARPRPARQLVGLVRLVHPLPSLLDALVVAGLALVAGAEPLVAARAATAMLLLQFAIGATNDVVDAAADRRVAPAKPIPAGLVTPSAALRIAGLLAVGGLLLAAAGGGASLAVAAAGLATGLAYDLRLKRTAWSWLPYAAGIPLLVIFGWTGAGLPVPGFIVAVAPLAGLAGAQLAIANTLADLEHDTAAGLTTVATRLGPVTARRLLRLLAVIVVGAAWLLLAVAARGGGAPAPVVAAIGSLVVAVGVVGSGARSPVLRRRAWEAQGAGLGLLALGLATALLASGPA